jgi:hypothetical protein
MTQLVQQALVKRQSRHLLFVSTTVFEIGSTFNSREDLLARSFWKLNSLQLEDKNQQDSNSKLVTQWQDILLQ